MRHDTFYLKVCLIGFLVLGACTAPIAALPTVQPPGASFQLIEFYSPL